MFIVEKIKADDVDKRDNIIDQQIARNLCTFKPPFPSMQLK